MSPDEITNFEGLVDGQPLSLYWCALQLQAVALLAGAWVLRPALRGRSPRLRKVADYLTVLSLLALPIVFALWAPPVPVTAIILARLTQLALPLAFPLGQTLTVLGILGAMLGLCRSVLGILQRRRLLADARCMSAREAERLELGELPCALRVSSRVHAPTLCGWPSPCLLVPPNFSKLPASDRKAIIAHELAHLRSADPLAFGLAAAVRSIYWVNPLAWSLARSLRSHAEMAADRAVIESGIRPSSYAKQLLHYARRGLGSRDLRRRIQSILDTPLETMAQCRPTHARPRGQGAALVLIAVVIASSTTACNAQRLGCGPTTSTPSTAPRDYNLEKPDEQGLP